MKTVAKIFLSHSSLDSKRIVSISESLKLRSRSDQQIQCLVDLESLRPGQQWPVQLHEMMACCDAGLLLLTKAAVSSGWVLKEATILSWRAALDSAFRLFVVRDPEVSDDELRLAKFDPLLLNSMQRVHSELANDIAEEIFIELDWHNQVCSPLDKLAKDLASLLGGLDKIKLSEIGRQLDLEAAAWRPGIGAEGQQADLLARRLIRGELGAYSGLAEFIDDIVRVTPTEVARKVFRLIAPYWVPGEAACCLPALGARHTQRVAAMNGAYLVDFSAPMFIQRAHLGSYLPEIINIPGDSPGDLVMHVTHNICSWYRSRTIRKFHSNESVIKAIARDTKVFRYVILPEPIPPLDVIRQLVSTFPTMRFLVGTGEGLDLPDDMDDAVLALEPEISVEIEEIQLLAFEQVTNLLLQA